MPPSCALLGGFAIGARLVLLWRNITRTRNVSEYMFVLALCLSFCARKNEIPESDQF